MVCPDQVSRENHSSDDEPNTDFRCSLVHFREVRINYRGYDVDDIRETNEHGREAQYRQRVAKQYFIRGSAVRQAQEHP